LAGREREELALPKIFFATDVHGSEVCWRKFLNAGEHYGAEILVLGGDMTGKAMIPLVSRDGGYQATLGDKRYEVSGEEEARELERRISDKGYYPVRIDTDRAQALSNDQAQVDELFQELMLDTVARWMEIAAEKLGGSGRRCIVCPGNDDVLEVDDVIRQSEVVELGEQRVIDEEGFRIASMGWTNATPWDTHREESEEKLRERIDRMASEFDDFERAIFNFHVPPYGTGLDEAPALDDELRPKQGGRAMEPVGSTAVRDAIADYQPLLSLHGHVHESRAAVRLGRCLAVNPGSAYDEGVLQGALVDLNAKKGKVRNYALLEG
jgi:Icc-related predicted phosphoesterase